MNMRLFALLRGVNRHVKAYKKARAGGLLSPCRRIEFVYPPDERVCAMTFDDGPCKLPGPDGLPITESLLLALREYGAHATFDVIGSTAQNYPDTPGAPGTHHVFGRKFDHYAAFEQDKLAGALACPELMKKIAAEGHELANHTFRHRIFGPHRTVYKEREFCRNLDEAVDDLARLHTLAYELTGREMKLARPPHYVDRLPDGRTAYDAYAHMGYHYMAASHDGGGWLPSCGSWQDTVEAMVAPLRTLLKENPDALRGAVIFGKDGLNMSREAPVVRALPQQLKLLAEYGYRVVSVSELMALCPYEDLPQTHPAMAAAKKLESSGHITGYRNNAFKPDKPITRGELVTLCAPRAELVLWTGLRDTGFSDVPRGHPYAGAAHWARETELFTDKCLHPTRPATTEEILRCGRAVGGGGYKPKNNTRAEAAMAISS